MTAELVLLLAVYAMLILGLFIHPQHGVVSTFYNNLPLLSARVEKHVATGTGFWPNHSSPVEWTAPPR
ncbi:MAG: hypothetical protein OXM55_05710 [Bdellovibrionales bacterium]|nr:hypothetical protein [Bdellovibrionales bacterium]